MKRRNLVGLQAIEKFAFVTPTTKAYLPLTRRYPNRSRDKMVIRVGSLGNENKSLLQLSIAGETALGLLSAHAERAGSGAPGPWLRNNTNAPPGVACTQLLAVFVMSL